MRHKKVGRVSLIGIILMALLIYGTLIIVETHPEKPLDAHIWDYPDWSWFGPLLGGTTILVLLAVYSAISTGYYANFEEASLSAKISTITCEIVGLPFAIFIFAGWMFTFLIGLIIFVFAFALLAVIVFGISNQPYGVKEGINKIIQMLEKLIS